MWLYCLIFQWNYVIWQWHLTYALFIIQIINYLSGLITSSQNVAYTISKFAGGVLSDKLDAKLMLIGGLFLTSLCTVLFTGEASVTLYALFHQFLYLIPFLAFDNAPLFAAVWFLQGLVQGGIWPACAKILREVSAYVVIKSWKSKNINFLQWCDADEFGTLWSFLSSAMNVAASIGPMLVAVLLASSTWRNAMLVIGTCRGLKEYFQ